MKNFELLLEVASVIIAPLFAIAVISRLTKLFKRGLGELSGIDFLNALTCVIMPVNLYGFYREQPENFMNAFWPSGLHLAALISVLLLIALISKFYADIKITAYSVTFVALFPLFAMFSVGYLYVTGTLSFGAMIALTLALIFVTVLICSFKPVWAEFKLRRLRKSLEPEYKSIFSKEERKLKRMKSKELEQLRDLYVSLNCKDYAKYDRYSKNKDYPKPLVLGSQIVGFSLSVIGRELGRREWWNFRLRD